MPVNSGGEATPLTPEENERPIDKFGFSPDGKTIAFVSADEKTEERKKREKEKDDALVWGENWPFNRLRLVDVATKEVTTLASKDAQIKEFAWNDDGNKLAFTEVRTPNIESGFLYGTSFYTVDVKTKEVNKLSFFPKGMWPDRFVWSGSNVYFGAPVAETNSTSSYCVYKISTSGDGGQEARYEHYAHGEKDCAFEMVKAGGDVVVYVQDGMEDQLKILGGHTLYGKKRKIDAWDASFTRDSDEVVLAIAQGDTNHPAEVFTTTASGGAMVQLSSHGKKFADRKFGTCTFLSCPSLDGKVTLECPWITPVSVPTKEDGTPSKPLPTAVLIHGGPYSRHTESFDALYYMWTPLLLDAGYGVLLADYRGSSGRGEDWAAYARGVGKYDYEDIIAQVQNAIEKGYADKDKLAAGGWSQGGFLSFLASVRNGTHNLGWTFKATMPGAGVSDADTMCLTSDIGSWQGEIASGGKPWQTSKEDTRSRQGSAIWEFGDAVRSEVPIPPMLILHGEKDERVPLEQAVGMRRAMEDAGLRYEYVVYPREGHIVKERRHLIDMGERVKKWCDRYIGGK